MEKYVNGSDMLMRISAGAVGHCTSHSLTISAETKDHAVKAVETAAASNGLWKEKTVTGLSASASAEGLCFYKETETGYKPCLAMIMQGKEVDVEFFQRGSTTAYLKGKFVITSLENTAPANDDATYSVSLESSGELEYDQSALNQGSDYMPPLEEATPVQPDTATKL